MTTDRRRKDGEKESQGRRRWLRWAAAFAVALLLLAVLLRAPVLRWAASGLTARTAWSTADRVLVYDGDRRFEEAARLYAAGRVRGALLVQQPPDRLVRRGILPSVEERAIEALGRLGLPAEAVEIVPGPARNEWEGARLLEGWLAQYPEDTVVVVCRLFQSRRYQGAVERVFGAGAERIAWHPVPDRRFEPGAWWRSKIGVLAFFNGWVSLGYSRFAGERPGVSLEWEPDAWLESRRDDFRGAEP